MSLVTALSFRKIVFSIKTHELVSWPKWFLEILVRGIQSSNRLIEKAIFLGDVYKYCFDKDLNERQRKVIKKMLEKFPSAYSQSMEKSS